MNLSEAEVAVTTRKETDDDTHRGDWFRLSDYGDAGEFFEACCSCFPDEESPVFRYPAWENIPGCLINEEWFCPDFFEIRDALERLDETETDCFMAWCDYHGHNIASDDPHLLVAYYQNNHTSCPEFTDEAVEIPDDPFAYQNSTDDILNVERYSFDIFSDNYD